MTSLSSMLSLPHRFYRPSISLKQGLVFSSFSLRKGDYLLICSMVWKRSLHLLGNPKMAWHLAHLIKEWGCVDLSMYTMHLNDSLVLFGFEGSALSLPLFIFHILSLFFINDRGPLFGHVLWHLVTFVCRCAFKHLFIHQFFDSINIILAILIKTSWIYIRFMCHLLSDLRNH